MSSAAPPPPPPPWQPPPPPPPDSGATCGAALGPGLLLGGQRGVLRLTAYWLGFEVGGQVVLCAPLHELHSVSLARAGTAMDVWHGPTRYRFLFRPYDGTEDPGPWTNPTAGLDYSVTREVTDAAAWGATRLWRRRSAARRWVTMLSARVGAAPPGVRVQRPLDPAAYIGLWVLVWAAVAVLALVALTVVVRSVF